MTTTVTCTDDGIWIAVDNATGVSASDATEEEALAELRRLLTVRRAA